MIKIRIWFFLFVAVLICGAMRAKAMSYYPVRLEDRKAVYLTPESFPVHGDGVTDDSTAIQAAIDRAAEHGEGIVFVPSGRYRVTRTIYVWPAVRVIGYGKTRPVFVLADDTPGYQQGLAYMFLFAGGKRRTESRIDFATGRPAEPIVGTVPPDASIPDANPGTFYSAMSNEDFEIGKGNPAAIAVRFHVAQHCYLAHMDFWIGSGRRPSRTLATRARTSTFMAGSMAL